jgi:hypothetical protein
MKIRIATIVPALILIAVPVLWSQPVAMQQKVADLKQSMAENRQKLMKYQWVQSTQVSIKGQVKKDQDEMCRYGPDGKVQKTLIGPPPAPPNIPTGGLKGRIAAKKVDEMKDYTERLKSLISHYAPPQPEMIQAAKDAGNVSLNATGGAVTLTFVNYYKPGDKVSFVIDTASKKLLSYDVNTYLDDPQKDIVTLSNHFASLPDGTNYLQQTVLNAQEKQIQVTTTNSNYSPVS